MTPSLSGGLIVWGFLAGFVGWAACFRIIEPVSNWLLVPTPNTPLITGLVRLFVMLFVMLAMLMLIALMPMLMIASGGADPSTIQWRAMLGLTFFSSLAGLCGYGVLARFSRST